MQYRHSQLWKNEITFPLERLHQLIATGTWSDAESEATWSSAYPDSPYQLWSDDPLTGGTLTLQDIEMICPWCKHTTTIDLKKFTAMHLKKTGTCECTGCKRRFNADSLSARFLRDDLLRFKERRDGWYPSPLPHIFNPFNNLLICQGGEGSLC